MKKLKIKRSTIRIIAEILIDSLCVFVKFFPRVRNQYDYDNEWYDR